MLVCSSPGWQKGITDWETTAPGALIPYMERDYNIGYAIVSLIFVSNAVGFILTAFFTDIVLSKLGRAKSCMLSEAVIIAGYVIITSTPPFPGIVVAYVVLIDI